MVTVEETGVTVNGEVDNDETETIEATEVTHEVKQKVIVKTEIYADQAEVDAGKEFTTEKTEVVTEEDEVTINEIAMTTEETEVDNREATEKACDGEADIRKEGTRKEKRDAEYVTYAKRLILKWNAHFVIPKSIKHCQQLQISWIRKYTSKVKIKLII